MYGIIIGMSSPTISAIAAIGQNRELGRGNDLIWKIPADLKRLKELTMGCPLIMGRKTYESIGRPLPGRTNIVITRDDTYQAPGCVVVTSLDAALAHACALMPHEIFIFGGAAIYELAMDSIERLYMTEIEASDTQADVFFPAFAEDFTIKKEYPKDTHEGLGFRWVDYTRKS